MGDGSHQEVGGEGNEEVKYMQEVCNQNKERFCRGRQFLSMEQSTAPHRGDKSSFLLHFQLG